MLPLEINNAYSNEPYTKIYLRLYTFTSSLLSIRSLSLTNGLVGVSNNTFFSRILVIFRGLAFTTLTFVSVW